MIDKNKKEEKKRINIDYNYKFKDWQKAKSPLLKAKIFKDCVWYWHKKYIEEWSMPKKPITLQAFALSLWLSYNKLLVWLKTHKEDKEIVDEWIDLMDLWDQVKDIKANSLQIWGLTNAYNPKITSTMLSHDHSIREKADESEWQDNGVNIVFNIVSPDENLEI